MASHCCLNVQFPNDVMLTIFHVCVSHVYTFFGEVFVQVFCPAFNWVVHFLIVEF